MKTKKLFLLYFAILFLNLNAQDKAYYVGHSLVNEHLPHMAKQIAQQKSVNAYYRHHINTGACLKLNWEDTLYAVGSLWNPDLGADEIHGTNHLRELTNSYNSIAVTECIDQDFAVNNLDSSAKYAANFINLAKSANPNIRKYVYATWGYANSGWPAWRTQVENNKDEWETLADKVNTLTGGGNTYIVPGNYAILALYDSVQAGVVPGITNINQLFSDLIHLNNNGNYYMACVMAATVYRVNPQGTGKILANIYSGDSGVTDVGLRAKLQQIAFNTVCGYARSGIGNCATVGIEDDINMENVTIYPNPVTGNGIQVITEYSSPLQIFDLQGKSIYKTQLALGENTIDLSMLSNGIYIIKAGNLVQKFIKE